MENVKTKEYPIFETKEQYFAMVDAWKASFKESGCSAYSLALYACLRGKDWRKGLSKGTDLDLVARLAYEVKNADYKYLALSPFKGTVTPEHIAKMREQEIPCTWE